MFFENSAKRTGASVGPDKAYIRIISFAHFFAEMELSY